MKYLHTMVRVSDLNESLNFYCDLLGLIEVKRYDSEQGRFSLIYLAAPEQAEQARESFSPTIELTYNWDPEKYDGGRNFGHLAFAVENIYDLCHKLQEAGVIINRPPRCGHMAFIKSPDGISIELLQQGDALPPQEPWKSMENTGSW
ncbi:VOC family protein [Pseudoalteromonas sp. McH1-7]|uniref:Lactoylglutathione lyase n=1 Tax=Pseudoalteromonas peptidolytica F12-50-A1 TaxID=1315280 RepID=A0A8I0MVL6_9GAMM|nr:MULTISPECIES: VOC family protein [Pseudoalteromonas]MBE0346626.1 lactoylglutathione lyase [Pseudoalteromonas peptidolytica F12-50-A1]MDW7550749.1 VOC family protein [Pseudoalteromonas peptidolytica]NLR15431.1 lactoylglutathione lyase [Pseudoalteromonas peptidolytica]NUZ12723.1 VOC family protein [Pseudoalteromonas sp. McH1-7]RXF03045.1 lactoylglutathione lyase [Pseudoalteromonas sp. PS5]